MIVFMIVVVVMVFIEVTVNLYRSRTFASFFTRTFIKILLYCLLMNWFFVIKFVGFGFKFLCMMSCMFEKVFDMFLMFVAYCCDTFIIFCCCSADVIWCYLVMNFCGEVMVIGFKNLVICMGNFRDLVYVVVMVVDVYENLSFGVEVNVDVIVICNINCIWCFGLMDVGKG